MLEKAGILVVAAALGTGAAVGVAACGEDRDGEVQFQTDGTGTEAGTGTETAPPTETAPATETAPETETESGGGATAPETETESGGGATAPETETAP
jgi:hypothetical protein